MWFVREFKFKFNGKRNADRVSSSPCTCAVCTIFSIETWKFRFTLFPLVESELEIVYSHIVHAVWTAEFHSALYFATSFFGNSAFFCVCFPAYERRDSV